jgi:uncharacterized protein YbjT (DUF2867 family)
MTNLRIVAASVVDENALKEVMRDIDAVVHCAGINREVGDQTYERVHVQGTATLVRAAEAAGVKKFVFVSFLRARPGTGSPYHESKWQAEEIVRRSSMDWTVVKPGMTYGRGDHMLDHLSHAFHSIPIFVGIGHRRARPVAIADVVRVLRAAVNGELPKSTVAVVGPTLIRFDDAARLVARVTHRKVLFVSLPLAFHQALALVCEAFMTVPMVSRAQVFMLREEVVEPTGIVDDLPPHLMPATPFDENSIRSGLPEAGRFRRTDFKWPARK